MRVKEADNGWPGIFIPGDEALSLANRLRMYADAIEKGDNKYLLDCMAIGMRNTAKQLDACKVGTDDWPFF